MDNSDLISDNVLDKDLKTYKNPLKKPFTKRFVTEETNPPRGMKPTMVQEITVLNVKVNNIWIN